MPRGVVVARQPLELKSLVRAQAGQPNARMFPIALYAFLCVSSELS